MSQREVDNVTDFFSSLDIAFEKIVHEPVRTSEDAARVRGCPIEDGVKAMVLDCKRGDRQFYVVADLAAHKKLDFKKLKEILRADDLQLCPLDRVESVTGCAPGGVPPLGHTPKLPLIVDKSVFERESSEFNCGVNTVSVRLRTADLKRAFEAYGAGFFEFSM